MFQPLRLKAENLACERGGRLVFSNVNFTVNAGELMELRGANGSGKSSLLRLLAGLNVPVAGRVRLEIELSLTPRHSRESENPTLASSDYSQLDSRLRGNDGVGRNRSLENDLLLSEQSHYIGHAEANKPALTVLENLNFWANFLATEMTSEALEPFNLKALANDQTLLLSAGQKRRLTLTRLVIAKRSLWLLDEPTVGLDAASLQNLQNLIKKHLHGGGMVIAATHVELGVASHRRLQLQ